MNWNDLSSITQLETIDTESATQPVVIFKHSTRCSISSAALARLERSWKEEGIKPYYLDLIAHRDISNAIASKYSVEHQSPQILLIKNGQAVYNESHMGIQVEDIFAAV
jgi:bacillithiol system protein YtxJ